MDKSVTIKLDDDQVQKVRKLKLFALEDGEESFNTSEILRMAIDAFFMIKTRQREESAKEQKP